MCGICAGHGNNGTEILAILKDGSPLTLLGKKNGVATLQCGKSQEIFYEEERKLEACINEWLNINN